MTMKKSIFFILLWVNALFVYPQEGKYEGSNSFIGSIFCNYDSIRQSRSELNCTKNQYLESILYHYDSICSRMSYHPDAGDFYVERFLFHSISIYHYKGKYYIWIIGNERYIPIACSDKDRNKIHPNFYGYIHNGDMNLCIYAKNRKEKAKIHNILGSLSFMPTLLIDEMFSRQIWSGSFDPYQCLYELSENDNTIKLVEKGFSLVELNKIHK